MLLQQQSIIEKTPINHITMGRINILYIDDEILNLKAFQASFRRMFNIYIAPTAEEGIEILNNHKIEVILSDQRMPERTGVDFFESILNTYPHPVRILLTAYSDINAVIDAINKGQVYRYVTKPWNDFDLKLTIENAYQLYLLKEQNNKLNVKYQKVFAESLDPIILFDLQGRIIDYNSATLDFVKTNSENTLHNKTFKSLLKNKESIKIIVNRIEKDNCIKDFECQLLGKKNTVKNCLLTVNAIKDNYQNTVSFLAIIKDYTKRNKLNQLLLKATIEAQEKERERISRDLHDGLGQQLVAIKMHIDVIDCPITKSNEQINMISSILKDSINELRRICYNTLPLILFDNGIITAIEDLIRKIQITSLEIDFNYTSTFPSLEKSLDIALFRIVQEFLSNAIKHSKASKIDIDLKYSNNKITLRLKDNGIGFEINSSAFEKKGHGLTNIKTRVASFHGELKMQSTSDNGTEFEIIIPVTVLDEVND